MKNRSYIVITVLLALLAALCLSACHTWDGFGKDVEDAGDSMQGK